MSLLRRALLSSKALNRGTIEGIGIKTTLKWQYAVESNLEVRIHTSGGYTFAETIIKGEQTNSVPLGPAEYIDDIISIKPSEDNFYIYEIIL